MKKANIMRGFKLAEVSMVDEPAQEGARITLRKRLGPFNKATDAPNPNADVELSMSEEEKAFYDGLSAADQAKFRDASPEERAAWIAGVDAPDELDDVAKAALIERFRDGLRQDIEDISKLKENDTMSVFKEHHEARTLGSTFMTKVAEIQSRDRCKKTVAMSRAQSRTP